MSGYRNQMTRVKIENSRYENGRLLVTVTGMRGERFEDIPWQEPHGFHSRPADGAVGYMSFPGGRRDQAVVSAAMDAKKVPQLGKGEAAMYDDGSNVVKLTGSGWAFNMDVTITGNLNVSGNIVAGGTITDSDGDGGA